MKSCKYNDFEIMFTKEKNDLKPKYDLFIFDTGIFDQELFLRAKNQIVFSANNYNNYLGVFSKFIVTKNADGIILLWTSFKGKPEIYHRTSEETFFDYLILSFSKKKHKVLYVGNSYECPLAGWRNQVNVDALTSVEYESMLDKYLSKTVETYLPF